MTDEEIGEELRQFFLALIADGRKMALYQNLETRSSVIQDFAPSDVQDILENGTLKEIERYIRLVTGNPTNAWPTIVVWPPM